MVKSKGPYLGRLERLGSGASAGGWAVEQASGPCAWTGSGVRLVSDDGK